MHKLTINHTSYGSSCGLKQTLHAITYMHFDFFSIHGDRMAKALACNARGDGFEPHIRRHTRGLFIESIQGEGTLNGLCGIAGINCAL